MYGNDLIKPRSNWVKDCIGFFNNIDWLSKKEDGIIEISLNKFRLKNINENDELRYFAKILCKQEKIKQEKLKKKKLSKVKKMEKQAENKLKKLGESQQTLF